jgi:hypothetical protein
MDSGFRLRRPRNDAVDLVQVTLLPGRAEEGGTSRPPTRTAALDTLSAAFLYPARIGGAASRLGCERPAAGALRFVLFHQRGGGEPNRDDMVRGRSGPGREADGGGVAQLVRAAES